MKVIILAGGLGTRLSEVTDVKPKPMVEIGNRPILWHIMKIYAAYDFREFIVALGYKGDVIKEYFMNYCNLENDMTIDLKSNKVDVHNGPADDWRIHLNDTGMHTQTGGRLKRLQDVIGDSIFMMTYGDGVADINIKELVDFHKKHQKIATITAVRPPARFGGLEFEGDRVSRFIEKPQIGEGWINGGFFVFDSRIFKYIKGDETIFEREPLEQLAREGELMAYRHNGFWQCMDTLRDVKLLNELWIGKKAAWKIW